MTGMSSHLTRWAFYLGNVTPYIGTLVFGVGIILFFHFYGWINAFHNPDIIWRNEFGRFGSLLTNTLNAGQSILNHRIRLTQDRYKLIDLDELAVRNGLLDNMINEWIQLTQHRICSNPRDEELSELARIVTESLGSGYIFKVRTKDDRVEGIDIHEAETNTFVKAKMKFAKIVVRDGNQEQQPLSDSYTLLHSVDVRCDDKVKEPQSSPASDKPGRESLPKQRSGELAVEEEPESEKENSLQGKEEHPQGVEAVKKPHGFLERSSSTRNPVGRGKPLLDELVQKDVTHSDSCPRLTERGSTSIKVVCTIKPNEHLLTCASADGAIEHTPSSVALQEIQLDPEQLAEIAADIPPNKLLKLLENSKVTPRMNHEGEISTIEIEINQTEICRLVTLLTEFSREHPKLSQQGSSSQDH